MKIDLVLYGIARDIAGASRLSMEFNDGVLAGDIMEQINSKYPDFKKLKSLLIAVNDEYAEDNQVIKEGDEVVLIPPVSGG
ncbi:MAG: MoaD/ThiS family protein [Cyclobacteriaceae bacterium]